MDKSILSRCQKQNRLRQPISSIKLVHYYPGVVVSKVYKPSETSTGVSSGVDSKGNPVMTTTTQTSDEEWDIIVSTHGTTEKATASPNRWAKIKEGDPIKVKETTGTIFHDVTDVRVE